MSGPPRADSGAGEGISAQLAPPAGRLAERGAAKPCCELLWPQMKLFSPRELERARERIRTPEFLPSWQRLQADTEEFLALELEPPAAAAGYYHDYFCPRHAVELRFDPRRPREHRCPVDGGLLEGDRYDAAWRFCANLLLSRMALLLGLRWRLDGDPRCRQRGAEILTGYARHYPRHAPGAYHTDFGAGRGRAAFQSLDEANLIVRLARSYDLLAEGMDAGSRRLVQDDLLAPAVAHLDEQRFRRLHNIECWHIAALLAAATLTGNAAIEEEVLHGEFGFQHQLDAGVRDDGLWWEGSSSYHYYTVAALLTTAALRYARDPGWNAPERLRAMLAAPLTLVLPDGRLPATNDCWASSSLFGEVCHGVPPAAALYEMAAGWWPRAAFAGLLAAAYRRTPRDSVEALLHGPDRVSASGGLERPRSGLLPASGYAVLRSDAPLAEQSLLLLKYGPHGGSHGHPDKLAILLYAGGAPAALDLGSQGYGIDLHRGWYRQSASHNTVLIAGRPQPPAAGELRHFGPPPEAAGAAADATAVTIADATVAWSGSEAGAYAGVTMRRVVAWRAPYFVDCCEVRCPEPSRIDWLLYVHGELLALPQAERSAAGRPELPHGPGWEHVEARWTGAAPAATAVRWSLAAGGLELLLPDEAGTALTVGEAPSNPASERMQALIRTRTARCARFVALLCPTPAEAGVTAVRRLGADHRADLEVVVGDRVDHWRLPATHDCPGPALVPI